MAASARERADALTAGLEAREARWLVEEFGSGEPLEAAVARRLAGEPLQYVIGHWPFRDLDLLVDRRVLIPRPETEQVVDWALEAIPPGNSTVRVLDLGCGSGAIGLAIVSDLRHRGVEARLVALDESGGALEVARANARATSLEATFVLSHWYDELDPAAAGGFDLIVANPPYVAHAELAGLDPVLTHEPEGALVADDTEDAEGFADVAAVIAGAPRWMAPGGAFVVEHGDRHGAPAREAARRAGLDEVRTRIDLAGRERALVARRPC
jgi:release factor glutamine methyltransferase